MKTIETPYGRKTPEMLCKAMDAYNRQPELLAALRSIANDTCNHGPGPICPREIARAAIAKAEKETP